MNCRTFFVSISLLATVVLQGIARENTIHNFGPASGPRLVFTATNQENRSAAEQLLRLADELAQNPQSVRISVIITENDFSVLPAEIRTGYPEGTKKVVSLLEQEESGTVFILKPGSKDSVSIRNGIKGETSPHWILERTVDSLNRMNMAWDVEDYRMPLYRLGWIAEDPLLASYLRANIPSLILETDAEITPVLLDIISSFNSPIPVKNDLHYLIAKWKGKLYFAGENIMVIAMIIASAVILFFLFNISFLFGKKSDQHLRDLVHLWWLPFLYLLVNLLCLFIGQSLASLLFKFRFGNRESWVLIPQLAFVGKLLFSSFFITVIVSLNQLIHLPEDNYIYGYIASIVCMINIFVFSSLDFSLCLLFLSVYCISFAVNHVRHPISQIAGILILLLPFYPYLRSLPALSPDVLRPLYTGSDFWNFRMALFAMPFQLMVSRVLLTLGIFGRKHRFYLPLNLIPVFIIAVAFCGVLLFIPAWSEKKPLEISVRQTIDSGGSHIEIKAPVELQNLSLEGINALESNTGPSADPSSFVQIQTTSRKFLDRQLVNIVIAPAIPVQKMEVIIKSVNGLSVYDASFPFILRDAGNESIFSTGENPETPFPISFSSDRASHLTATVRIWTRSNPWGLVIDKKSLSTDFLLEIVQTVKLDNPELAGILQ